MFKKLTGKKCVNPKCKMVEVPQDAGLSVCECGSDLSGMYVPDTQKNMVAITAGLAVVALLGVFGYEQLMNRLSPVALFRMVFTGQRPVAVATSPEAAPVIPSEISQPQPNPGTHETAQNPQAPEFRWVVETQAGGADSVLSSDDGFIKMPDGSYRAKQVFSNGDRFRFRFPQQKNDWVWVFYKKGDDLQRLAETHGERSQVPAQDEWIRMDQHPGTEQFVFVSAAESLGLMKGWKDGINYEQARPELSRLMQNQGVSVVQVDLMHQ